MRTSLSFNLSRSAAVKTKKMARARGFVTTSDYMRFLLEQDDVDFINEDELVKRAQDVNRLHKKRKLIRAHSLADLVK